MSDPVIALLPLFRHALSLAFGDEFAATDPMLRASKHADFQANCPLQLGKVLKRAPREVARLLLEQLAHADIIERAEVSGPGFINVWLSNEYLARALAEASSDLGLTPTETPETVVVDYSSPNVAKELHIGNLRSTIIGDALCRVLEAVGHRVLRQNHLGDWGTPFGMLIENLLEGDGEVSEHTIKDLNAFYQAARKKFDSDPAFAERARNRVVMLQGGDVETLSLWKKLVLASTRYFNTIYDLLGVTLKDQHIAGESLYNPWLAQVVEDLIARNLAVESDGAICVFPPGFLGREQQPLPLIIRKQDGGYGYATTDLAAVRYRTQSLHATRILYVVGASQAQHLSMVFAGAKLAGWLAEPARAEHVSFGAILGTDKKMFRTRAGETIRLLDLLNEAVSRAQAIVAEKNPNLPPEVQHSIARAVGIGAVKYADLSNDRCKDYVFDWDRMLAFDGNTAPYLQYAHARIRSIFRKGEADVPSVSAVRIVAPEEKALALTLLAYPTVVREVAESSDPHKMCGYLYELATAFSTFYERCPVLKASSQPERDSRLVLCDFTARVLSQSLGLLGIESPEKM
jgi:arginyl-tRNA synthetase